MTRHASASPPDAGDPLRPGASDSAGVRAEITEKMLLSAARLAKIGYWVWDHRRNACVYCSDELAAIHQLSPEAYRERFGDPERMLDWFHPADREQYRETWEQEACRGVAYTVDVRTLRTDGSTVHVRETGQPIFDDDGQLIYTAGTLQDISEFTLAYQRARIAEERLRDAIEALPDGFVLFDSEDRLVLCNTRYREMNAHISDILEPGVTFSEIMRTCVARDAQWDTRKGAEDWLTDRIAAHHDPGEPLEERLPDGRWVRVVERITRQGENAGFRVDITEFKRQQHALNRLATDLQQQLRKANEANAAKNQFLAGVSHELRTPLNAIIGFAEILHNELFGELGNTHYKEYAKQIYESGNFLLSLVNDLIDVSRIAAGVKQLEVTNQDLRAVVGDVVPKIWPRARRARVRLRTRVGHDLPPVQADERALRQILMNLLSNAVKFTPAGGRICVAASACHDGMLGLEVTDTGPGIPADKLAYLGTPFQTVGDDPHKSDHQSSGLGLAIVKGLTEEMGGTMAIASEVGDGTRVRISLPAAVVAEAAD